MCCANFGILTHLLNLNFFVLFAVISMVVYCAIYPTQQLNMIALHGTEVYGRSGSLSMHSLCISSSSLWVVTTQNTYSLHVAV